MACEQNVRHSREERVRKSLIGKTAGRRTCQQEIAQLEYGQPKAIWVETTKNVPALASNQGMDRK